MRKIFLICILLLLMGCSDEPQERPKIFDNMRILKQYKNGMELVEVEKHQYFINYYYGFHSESCPCKLKLGVIDHGNIERDRKIGN